MGKPASYLMRIIGTPLTQGKDFKPVWKQELKNNYGGKRLHGAFQGGFSAGYFNTVGSKEGWTPASFRSSRGERAVVKHHGADTYMDAEDESEIRDYSRLAISENYSSGTNKGHTIGITSLTSYISEASLFFELRL